MNLKGLIKVFLFVLIIFILVINVFAHREFFKNADVQMVTCINYLGTYDKMEYTESEDINKVLKGIRWIKFYKNYKNKPMQASPTSSITILYKNGRKRVISISGNIAVIYEGADRYRYFVSMIDVKNFFGSLK